jgi:hypothetical protein
MNVFTVEIGHAYDTPDETKVYLFKRSALKAVRALIDETWVQAPKGWIELGDLQWAKGYSYITLTKTRLLVKSN